MISEKTGGAESFNYGSFLSRSVRSVRGGLAKFEALPESEHSLDVAQLASRVASAMHAGTSYGDNPFAKVKGLISEIIARLQEEASADAKGRDVYICEYLYGTVVLSSDEGTDGVSSIGDEESSLSAPTCRRLMIS